MKVSVIIPVYNMANGCVQRCLDSLVQQTVLKRQIADLEIICVDDCSTDNSLEIMKVYEEKFKNTIFVYHLETNRKQGGARNFGFLKSTGDYICYVDADDYVSPEFVEKLLNKAIASNAEVVNCNLCRTHEFSFEYDVKDATDYRFSRFLFGFYFKETACFAKRRYSCY